VWYSYLPIYIVEFVFFFSNLLVYVCVELRESRTEGEWMVDDGWTTDGGPATYKV